MPNPVHLPDWLFHNLPQTALRALILLDGIEAGIHQSRYFENRSLFSEYRPYTYGDPLKSVDWKVYGRMEKLYTRKYSPQVSAQVVIAIDASASMSEPYPEKWENSCSLSLALAYLYLRQGDSLTFLLYEDFSQETYRMTNLREWGGVARQVDRWQTRGRVNGQSWTEHLSSEIRTKGILLLISDFLFPHADRLAALRKRHDLVFFQPLHKKERAAKSLSLLEDVETKEEVFLKSGLSYSKAFESFLTSIDKLCKDFAIPLYRFYAPHSAREPLLAFLNQRT